MEKDWPIPEHMSGEGFIMRRLALADAPLLMAIGSDEALRYLSKRPRSWLREDVEGFIQDLLLTPNAAFYLILSDKSALPLGMTAYLDINAANRRIEIGWTWLSSSSMGSGLNAKIKNAMIDYAFSMGCERVCLTTDARNKRSQRAIEKLGAVKEGVLRKYGRMPDGFQRDVIIYSIVRSEWMLSRDTNDSGASAEKHRERNASRVKDEFDRLAYEAAFNRSYYIAYALFEQALRRVASGLPQPWRIIDVGCGDGWTMTLVSEYGSGRYVGVDASQAALQTLMQRTKPPSLATATIQTSCPGVFDSDVARQCTDFLGGQADLVICNAMLHELKREGVEISEVLSSCISLLTPGGRLLVGDYWYPPSASSSSIAASLEWIRSTGHTPTEPEQLLNPELISVVCSRSGCEVSAVIHGPARPDMALSYYVVCAMKKSAGATG